MKKLLITTLALLSSTTFAAEFSVAMKNTGKNGIMVFEPAVIKIELGDTVKFIAADSGHNSASIAGMTPQGAQSWYGQIDEEITVTPKVEGVYVYECSPHSSMAMLGVIVVGNPTNLADIKEQSKTHAEKMMQNEDRLKGYLAQIQ